MTTDRLSVRPPSVERLAASLGIGLVALVLLVGAAIGARSSPALFVGFAGALVGLLGAAAYRWPRGTLVAVVMSPIVDRYVVADMLPDELTTMAHYLSEALLLVVGLVIAARAWRDGRLVRALVHPVTVALLVFAILGLTSAAVNGVPAVVALTGLVFTLDAVALFFLPRVVGFSQRQSFVAFGVIGAVVVVAAILVIGQAALHPRMLGFEPIRGRFGEAARLASIFGDPNVFGAFVVASVPFALLMATRLPSRGQRLAAGAVAFVLLLALWLSFSRGAWIALVLGVGLTLAIVDRRTLVVGALLAVVTFGVADVMPRSLLVPEREPRPKLVDSTVDRVETVGLGGDLRTLFVIHSMPILADHPIVGVGPGRYGGAVAHSFGTPIYGEYGHDRLFWNPTQRTVDNFWLHILIEAGIAGFVAFLAAAMIPGLRILGAARHAVGSRRIFLAGTAAAAAGMAASSLTTMLLEANSIAFLFWFTLAVGGMVAALGTMDDDPAGTPAASAASG